MTDAQLIELRKIKQSSNPYHTVINAAMGLTLKTGTLRSVYWKVLLGILPVPTHKDEEFLEDWEEEMLDKRKELMDRKKAAGGNAGGGGGGGKSAEEKKKEKKKKRFGDTDSSSEEEEEVASTKDDPLSTASDSKYAIQFQQNKVIESIEKDTSRLWCDDPFFDDDDLKDQIKNVLLEHCVNGDGKELGYRQGMHEVLSLLFYVLIRDAEEVQSASIKVSTTEEEKEHISLLRLVCSRTFVEQDAHMMFDKIMTAGPGCLNLASWYGAASGSPRSSQPASPSVDLGQSALSRMDAHDEQNAVVAAAHVIQRDKLQKVDEPLFTHLNKKLSIPPQSYLLRWLRLLFLREFSFSQAALVWDVVFAELRYETAGEKNKVPEDDEDALPFDLSTSFLVDISVQMLEYISKELLQADYSFALRRLMRYPPVEDVSPIIRRALQSRHEPGSPMLLAAGILETKRSPSPPAGGAHVDPTEIPSIAPAAASARSTTSPAPAASASASPARAAAASAPPPVVAGETADELRDKQLRMGLLLANVVTRMEDKWFPPEQDGRRSPNSEAQVEENYVIAIAELKKVRDVLLNNVSM